MRRGLRQWLRAFQSPMSAPLCAGMKSIWDLSLSPFSEVVPFCFCNLVRARVEIMLQRIEDYRKPNLYEMRAGLGVWDAYIRMEGVKEFYESVRQNLEILRPLEKQSYGDWEFEVKDPNGYVLVFSELTD